MFMRLKCDFSARMMTNVSGHISPMSVFKKCGYGKCTSAQGDDTIDSICCIDHINLFNYVHTCCQCHQISLLL